MKRANIIVKGEVQYIVTNAIIVIAIATTITTIVLFMSRACRKNIIPIILKFT